MKKLLAIIPATLMLLSLVSCGDVPAEELVTDPPVVTEDIEAEEMVTEDDVVVEDDVAVAETVAEEASDEVVHVVGWTDEMICSEELKGLVSEYTVLRKLFSTGYMSSSYEMVEVDGHEYYKVTDQRYNTWEEWEAYIRYYFADDLAEERLEDDLFLNVDGYLYCSTGGVGYPYTDDYTYELLTNGDGVATVRVSIPSVWDDDEPNVRILTLVLDDEHWKISDIAPE